MSNKHAPITLNNISKWGKTYGDYVQMPDHEKFVVFDALSRRACVNHSHRIEKEITS